MELSLGSDMKKNAALKASFLCRHSIASGLAVSNLGRPQFSCGIRPARQVVCFV
jgi:hypothetical protein